MCVEVVKVVQYSSLRYSTSLVPKFAFLFFSWIYKKVMPEKWKRGGIRRLPKDITNLSYNCQYKTSLLQLKKFILKERCNKSLLKKLKKYRLRKDGLEDPDIIDISKHFRSSLRIRSPNHEPGLESKFECKETKIKNYLFKMDKKSSNNKITKQKVHKDYTLQNITLSNSCHIEQSEFSLLNASQNIQVSINHEIFGNSKQVNAFHLLMNSHNKSIGSNSPGKTKSGDEFDSEDIASKRALKIKRNSVLQKMAEAKGYLKHLENEESKDAYVKEKMVKRKERLKKILTTKKESNRSQNWNVKKSPQNKKKEKKSTTDNSSKHTDKTNDKIMVACKLRPRMKNISKDDEDFLKKLSPSIRKTENVLCYFEKIDKKRSSNDIDDFDNEEAESLLKVKLTSKNKQKITRKNKHVITNTNMKDNSNSVSKKNRACKLLNVNVSEKISSILEEKEVDSINNLGDNNVAETSKKRKRREIKEKEEKVKQDENRHNSLTDTIPTKSRPKRCINKPVKYSDKYELSSSEDDLHIFTPKKKKHSIRNSPKNFTQVKLINGKDRNLKNNLKSSAKGTTDKKNGSKKCASKKLAPIFTKTQRDTAALEAKQKFLHSGMPDQIKKIISKQNSIQVGIDDFPVTKHVQQNKLELGDQFQRQLHILPLTLIEFVPDEKEFSFTSLLNLSNTNNICISTLLKNNVRKTLKLIKEGYSRFPVYRTYYALKNKCLSCSQDSNDYLEHSGEILNNVVSEKIENFNTLNWSEKYRPSATKEIIGNFEPVKELKKWLMLWKENEMAARTVINNDSDTSDFYNSDTDSRDSLRSNNNLIIITGPVGSGKTSCVYAVATELAMKVIEVNASSRRTGKIMLQDLQEATQSHKVDRTKGTTSDNSQNSQETVLGGSKKQKIANQLLPKKKFLKPESVENSSQTSNRTEISLILIDDADIVFDQDDGFASALSQIVQCSKRPVIIVTTTLSSPHLQKYFLYGHVLKMNRLMPRMLGTWLDILCMVDSGQCAPGLGAKFLEYFRGDLRKSINALQFLISSQSFSKHCVSVTEGGELEDSIEDENSNLSWANADDNALQPQPLNPLDALSSLFNSDLSSLDTIQSSHTITNLSAWWHLPLPSGASSDDSMSLSKENEIDRNSIAELSTISTAVDSISLSDILMYRIKPNSRNHIVSHPWFTPECDSVCERDNVESYSRSRDLGYEICSELVQKSVDLAQKTFARRTCQSAVPEMVLEREKEKVIHRHNLLTNSFNMSITLDRRALAADYWSTCRTICRLEKDKSNSNTKRKNRYCHYLKTLKVSCNYDSYNKLCDSLCTKDTKKT